MTNICLVRHGQTDWNKDFKIQGRYNIPLNETGRNQIIETSKRIQALNISWDIFLSSPLDRAIETCNIIKNNLKYNVKTILMDDLIEREFGIADGIIITDEVYERILRDDYQGIEKTIDIQNRAYQAILKIATLYPNKNILITTHSHFIKALFTKLDSTLSFKSTLANGALNFISLDGLKIINYSFNN